MVKKLNLKKIYTSPADEYILEVIGKWKKVKKKVIKKNVQVQLVSFYCINGEKIGKWKNVIYFFKSEKMLQVQLMSFYLINVETMGSNRKIKKRVKNNNFEKCTIPVCLLHRHVRRY